MGRVDRREYGALTAIVAAVAGIGVVCAVEVHQACVNAFPFAGPQAGTSRAAYCNVVEPTHPVLSLTLMPAAVVLLVGVAVRMKVRQILIVAAAISALLIGNAIVANELNYALPLP